jgi:hypothetical protein
VSLALFAEHVVTTAVLFDGGVALGAKLAVLWVLLHPLLLYVKMNDNFGKIYNF